MDAYEARFKTLELANQILTESAWAERNRLERDWEAANQRGPYPVVPKVTYEEVLRVASELEAFVFGAPSRKKTDKTEWMGK